LHEKARITLGEFPVYQRTLRPIHQLCQRHLVVEIRGNLVSNGLFGQRIGSVLHFLTAFIHWEFFVDLLDSGVDIAARCPYQALSQLAWSEVGTPRCGVRGVT
jgi:hypothetical protein